MDYFGDCKHDQTPTCLGDIPHDTSNADVINYLTHYTVFTIVRNPFSRAASAYSYLNSQVRSSFVSKQRMADPLCSVNWAEYCTDPRVLATHCRVFPQCCGNDKDGMKLNSLIMHTDPQAPCMLGDDGTWAVDFILRAEQSDQDIRELVSLLNSKLPEGVKPLESKVLGRSNVGGCEKREAERALLGVDAGDSATEGRGQLVVQKVVGDSNEGLKSATRKRGKGEGIAARSEACTDSSAASSSATPTSVANRPSGATQGDKLGAKQATGLATVQQKASRGNASRRTADVQSAASTSTTWNYSDHEEDANNMECSGGVAQYMEYYVNNWACFEGVRNFYKEDIEVLQFRPRS